MKIQQVEYLVIHRLKELIFATAIGPNDNIKPAHIESLVSHQLLFFILALLIIEINPLHIYIIPVFAAKIHKKFHIAILFIK